MSVLTARAAVDFGPNYKQRFNVSLHGAIASCFGQLVHPTENLEPLEARIHVEVANLPNLLGRVIQVTMGTEAALDPGGQAARIQREQAK